MRVAFWFCKEEPLPSLPCRKYSYTHPAKGIRESHPRRISSQNVKICPVRKLKMHEALPYYRYRSLWIGVLCRYSLAHRPWRCWIITISCITYLMKPSSSSTGLCSHITYRLLSVNTANWIECRQTKVAYVMKLLTWIRSAGLRYVSWHTRWPDVTRLIALWRYVHEQLCTWPSVMTTSFGDVTGIAAPEMLDNRTWSGVQQLQLHSRPRPTTIWGHYTTCCKSQSCAPEDGQRIARNMLS